jgi:hypothetical protein
MIMSKPRGVAPAGRPVPENCSKICAGWALRPVRRSRGLLAHGGGPIVFRYLLFVGGLVHFMLRASDG